MGRVARLFFIAYVIGFSYVIFYLVSEVTQFWTLGVVRALRQISWVG